MERQVFDSVGKKYGTILFFPVSVYNSHILHYRTVGGKTDMKLVFQFSLYLDSLLRCNVDYEHSIQGWLCHINKLVLDVDR